MRRLEGSGSRPGGEERYRSILAAAPDAYVAMDLDGRIVDWNPKAEQLFGWTADEVIGRQFDEVILPERDREAHRKGLAHFRATGEAAVFGDRIEVCARHRDGHELMVELSVWPSEADGDTLVNAFVHDIAGRALDRDLRHQSEERFRELEGEARFELVFDESPLGIGLAGPDFVFMRVNEAICRIFGYSEAEMLALTFVDITHPDDGAELIGQASEMYSGAIPRMDCQCRGVRKDGEIIWYQVHASVIKAADGEIRYAIGLVEDITERKREQELFDTFFSSSADLLCMADFNGYFTAVNDAWTASLGWTSDELCAAPFVDFVHPDDVAPTNEQYAGQLAAGAPVISFENRYRCSDGSYRWLEWNAVSLPDQQLVVCNARDTTAVKALAVAADDLNEELRRSNAELEQFAYIASHDLQEPLRMVGSYVQLLQRRYKGRLDDDADEFIGFAVDGANRMQSLIQDLLSYSRLGRRPRPFEPVDTAAVIDSVLEVIGGTIDETGAEIRHGDLPTVRGDLTQLTQLFQNLIGNALKYRRDEPPIVQIAAERLSDAWWFSVADNGIGIDPVHGDRIFDMFQRLHGRDEFSGTGIGLAICKRVVDLHGGDIWVEPGPDGGSMFRFTLPLRLRHEDVHRGVD